MSRKLTFSVEPLFASNFVSIDMLNFGMNEHYKILLIFFLSYFILKIFKLKCYTIFTYIVFFAKVVV